MMYRLKIALKNNDITELNNYMTWAAETSQRTPEANIYINCVRVLIKLGQDEEAKILLQQTLLLYPNNKLVQNLYASQADRTQPQ
jgi:uncharacterized protein HemY